MIDETLPAGPHARTWRANGDLAPGHYLLRAAIGAEVYTLPLDIVP